MGSVQQAVSTRQCVYCGKPVAPHQTQCPHCRETVPKVRLGPAPASSPASKGGQIRRGILYMILGLVIHYISLHADILNLPFSMNPTVNYLSTMVFLAGSALAVYGFFTKVTT
ncbi:MAG TPA: hypothetical protein VFB23_09040 [Candidatus Acidoferrales bacterium]|nr:hypothetical protein [Candidatus Acidoferrales bacterium]